MCTGCVLVITEKLVIESGMRELVMCVGYFLNSVVINNSGGR
jgi:hypothetical protein